MEVLSLKPKDTTQGLTGGESCSPSYPSVLVWWLIVSNLTVCRLLDSLILSPHILLKLSSLLNLIVSLVSLTPFIIFHSFIYSFSLTSSTPLHVHGHNLLKFSVFSTSYRLSLRSRRCSPSITLSLHLSHLSPLWVTCTLAIIHVLILASPDSLVAFDYSPSLSRSFSSLSFILSLDNGFSCLRFSFYFRLQCASSFGHVSLLLRSLLCPVVFSYVFNVLAVWKGLSNDMFSSLLFGFLVIQ